MGRLALLAEKADTPEADTPKADIPKADTSEADTPEQQQTGGRIARLAAAPPYPPYSPQSPRRPRSEDNSGGGELLEHIIFSGKTLAESDIVTQSDTARQILKNFEETGGDTLGLENSLLLSELFDLPLDQVVMMKPEMVKHLYNDRLNRLSEAVINKDLKETIKDEFSGMNAVKKIPLVGGIAATVEQIEILQAIERLNGGWDYGEPQKIKIQHFGNQMGLMAGFQTPAMKKVQQGERTVTIKRKDDEALVAAYIKKLDEESRTRYTFMGKVARGASVLPTWMAEFAISGGLAGFADDAARKTGEKLLGKYMQNTMGRVANKLAGKAAGASVRASTVLLPRVGKKAAERQLQSELGFKDEENWATSIARGWGDVAIESLSEEAGGAITKGLGKAIAITPFGRKFVNALQKGWMKVTGGKAGSFASKILTKSGYSNIIGEIGEEDLGAILREVTGVSDREGNFAERIWEAIKERNKLENRAVETVVLGIPGLTRMAINTLARTIPDGEGFRELQLESTEQAEQAAGGMIDYAKKNGYNIEVITEGNILKAREIDPEARKQQPPIQNSEQVSAKVADEIATPTEIVDMSTLPDIGEYKSTDELRAKVRKYAFVNFDKKVVTVKSNGDKVLFNKSGIKHDTRGHNNNKLKTTLLAPKLLENSVHIQSEPDTKNRADIIAVHKYRSILSDKDKTHNIILVVREHKDGKKYYDHHIEGKRVLAEPGTTVKQLGIQSMSSTPADIIRQKRPDAKEKTEKSSADSGKVTGADIAKYEKANPDFVINADRAKLTLDGYNTKDISNERKFHGKAGSLAGAVYEKWLKERRGKGNNTVLFTGGGTGSGKSMVIEAVSSHEENSIVVDSTLSSEYWSTYQIDKALEEGYDIEIRYVYRYPADAWENGVWKRYEEGGHFVPAENFLKTHRLSRENILEIAEKYGDKVNIRVFENRTGKAAKEITLDDLANKRYNLEELKEQINEISRQKIKQHPHLKGAEGLFLQQEGRSYNSSSPERRKPEISQRAARQEQQVAVFEPQKTAAGKNLTSDQITIPYKAQTEALAPNVYPRMLEEQKNQTRLNRPQRKTELSPAENDAIDYSAEDIENYFNENWRKLRDEYIARNKNYASTDEARLMFGPVGYDIKKSNDNDYQKVAGRLSKRIFDKMLKMRRNEGNGYALFTAGGSGSAKTTMTRKLLGDEFDEYSVVLDSNLADLKSAKDKIDRTIKAGLKPTIMYFYRDPVAAWKDGVLKRVEEGGRYVPVDVHIRMHESSAKVAAELADIYEGKIEFNVIENTGSIYEPKIIENPVDYLDSISYDTSEIRKDIYEITEQKIKEGSIDPRRITDLQRRTGTARTSERAERGRREAGQEEGRKTEGRKTEGRQDRQRDEQQSRQRNRIAAPYTLTQNAEHTSRESLKSQNPITGTAGYHNKPAKEARTEALAQNLYPSMLEEQKTAADQLEGTGIEHSEAERLARLSTEGLEKSIPENKPSELEKVEAEIKAERESEGDTKPVKITGKEIPLTDSRKANIGIAKKYGKDLRGVYRNEDTGWDIYLFMDGINETVNHARQPYQFQSIAAIPDLIKKAKKIRTEKAQKEMFAKAHIFEAYLEIASEPYRAEMVVLERQNGKKEIIEERLYNIKTKRPAKVLADDKAIASSVSTQSESSNNIIRQKTPDATEKKTGNLDPEKIYFRSLEASPESYQVKAVKAIVRLYDNIIAKVKTRGNDQYENIRRVTPDEISLLNSLLDTPVDSETVHMVDESGIRHGIDGHGIDEEFRGQHIPLEKRDFERIPEILNSPDEIIRSKTDTKQGLAAIRYKKRVNGHVFYVVEHRTGRNKLAMKTMWKVTSNKKDDTSAPLHTSRTLLPRKQTQDVSDASPADNIHQKTPDATEKSSADSIYSAEDIENYFNENWRKLRDEYIARNKNYASTDEARLMFGPVGYDIKKSNDNDYQKVAGRLSKRIFDKMLKMRRNEGNGKVIFTAGGSGTAKTTMTRKLLGDELDEYSVVLDSNLADLKSAKDKIDRTIKAGLKPIIMYFYRDPVVAWESGVLTRVEEGGRYVPVDVHIRMHESSAKVTAELADIYGNKIDLYVFENTGSIYEPKIIENPVDYLDSISYDTSEIRKDIYEITEQKIKEGSIDPRRITDLRWRTGTARTSERAERGRREAGQEEGRKTEGRQDRQRDEQQSRQRNRIAAPYTLTQSAEHTSRESLKSPKNPKSPITGTAGYHNKPAKEALAQNLYPSMLEEQKTDADSKVSGSRTNISGQTAEGEYFDPYDPDAVVDLTRQVETVNVSRNAIKLSGSVSQKRKQAAEYGETLRGTYSNKHTGWNIHLFRDGVRDTAWNTRKDDNLVAIAALPEIIEDAVWFASEDINSQDKARRGFVKSHVFYAAVNVGDTPYIARLRVLEHVSGEMDLVQERLYNLKLKDPAKPDGGINRNLPVPSQDGILFKTISDLLPYVKEEYRSRQYKSTNIIRQEKPTLTQSAEHTSRENLKRPKSPITGTAGYHNKPAKEARTEALAQNLYHSMLEEQKTDADSKVSGSRTNISGQTAEGKYFDPYDPDAVVDLTRQVETVNVSRNAIKLSGKLGHKRLQAKEFGKKIRGAYLNKHTGWDINLFQDGIDDTIWNTRNEDNLVAIAALPEIIQEAVWFASEDINSKDKVQRGFVKSHVFYAAVNVGDTPYIARLRVLEHENNVRKLVEERLYNLKLKDPVELKADVKPKSPTVSLQDGILFKTISDLLPYVKEEYRSRQYKSTNIIRQEKPTLTQSAEHTSRESLKSQKNPKSPITGTAGYRNKPAKEAQTETSAQNLYPSMLEEQKKQTSLNRPQRKTESAFREDRFSDVVKLDTSVINHYENISDLRKQAKDYAFEHLAGTKAEVESNGDVIEISKNKIKHGLVHHNEIKLRAIFALDKLIHKSKKIGDPQPDMGGNEKIKYHRYLSVMNDGDKNIPVIIVAKQTSDGHKYYDHCEAQERDPSVKSSPAAAKNWPLTSLSNIIINEKGWKFKKNSEKKPDAKEKKTGNLDPENIYQRSMAETAGQAPGKIIKISGDEFGTGKAKEIRKRALKWAKENLVYTPENGRTFKNDQTQREIVISASGIKHTVTMGRKKELYASISKLPEIIKQAKLKSQEAEKKGHTGVQSVDTFTTDIVVDGREYTVDVIVKNYSAGMLSEPELVDIYYHHKIKGGRLPTPK